MSTLECYIIITCQSKAPPRTVWVRNFKKPTDPDGAGILQGQGYGSKDISLAESTTLHRLEKNFSKVYSLRKKSSA